MCSFVDIEVILMSGYVYLRLEIMSINLAVYFNKTSIYGPYGRLISKV